MLPEPNGLTIGKLDTNLYRVALPAKDIGYLQPYVGQATSGQKKTWFEALLLLCDTVSATSFKQIIIQHPFWWQLTRSIPPEFQLIYDCMDDISGFANTSPFVLDLEKNLVANCDSLIVSSQALFDKYKGEQSLLDSLEMVRMSSILFLKSECSRLASLKQNLPSLRLPQFESASSDDSLINVGYVGAIDDWFDAELVGNVAASEPDFRIHLCGAVTSRKVDQDSSKCGKCLPVWRDPVR